MLGYVINVRVLTFGIQEMDELQFVNLLMHIISVLYFDVAFVKEKKTISLFIKTVATDLVHSAIFFFSSLVSYICQ